MQAFVLRIAPSGIDRVSEALEENELIIGWSQASGLLDPGLGWEEFREIVRATYHSDEPTLRRAGAAAGHLWRFIREMRPGDLVVVPYGHQFFVGRITGDARYDESKVGDDTAYRRPVEWLNGKKGIPRSIARSPLISLMKIQGTCAQADDLLSEIQECLTIASEGRTPSFQGDLKARLISETLHEIRTGRMEDYGFERLVASVLAELGAVQTEIVPRQKDVGVDLYATFLIAGTFRQIVGVQVKHYQENPPVGREVVQQLVRGLELGSEKASLGMVVTSGTYGDDAWEEAERYSDEKRIPIELIDGEQFAKLIVENGLRWREQEAS